MISVFLLSMLFTVIRYLPVLEEETPGHSVDMAKKAKPADTSGDDNDDDSDDDSTENDLFYHEHSQALSALSSEHFFYLKHSSYCWPVASINTPPPKI